MYNAEVKNKTLLLLKEHSVKEVAEQTKISIPTLYKWKKEHEILIQKSKEIKLFIAKGEYEKGIELANQFPNDELIQNKLSNLNDLINYQEKFEKNGLKEANLSEINLDDKEKKFDRNINILRAKILSGIICLDDIQNLDSIKYQLEEREYLLIKACIFEKLNLKKKCVETVQEITDITSKDKNQLLQSIAKNNKFFSLEKWDYLIGWSIDSVDEYLEVSKLEVSPKENKCSVQKSKKIKDNIQTENLSSEKKEKRKKDLKVISGSFSSQRTKNISKNKSEKVRKQTIYESLNSDYKQAVYDLKLKYYLEMYDEHKKIDAMFKYDRLEDVLNCENSNSKAFYQLLLMLRDIQYNFEKDYPKEYEIINNRISEAKVLTKKG